MNYHFIEIGTSNFNTIIQSCNDLDFGICVEPLQHYLNDLPDKINVRKICAALSHTSGEAEIYHVEPHVIESLKLKPWIKGCNSINSPHPTVQKELGIRHDEIVTISKIRMITWEELINENNVTGISFLKVDTEGHDSVIIQHYLELCNKRPELLAKEILFESNILSDKFLEQKNLHKLVELGYKCKRLSDDIYCRLNY